MSTEQTTVPPSGSLSRLSAPAFWALAVSAGAAGAAFLFLIVGSILTATDQSAMTVGLSAIAAGLIGFLGPILVLRARRNVSKAPRARREPPDIGRTVGVGPQSDTPPASPQEPNGPAEWFYAEGGKRVGPVSADELHRMIADGVLPRTTLVWRNGMADWVTIADSELSEKASPTAPPPLSPTGIANGWIWALALAPLWGEVLQYVAIYMYLAFKGQPRFLWDLEAQLLVEKTWYIPVSLNWSLALADLEALKAAGWKNQKLNRWLAILVPVYIYKRDQLVGANMARFWVWIGALIVSVLIG